MNDSITCVCTEYSKPIFNTIQCESLTCNKEEIFESAKKYNGFILNADCISFNNKEDFQNFWNFIVSKNL